MFSLQTADGTELLEQAKGETYLPLTIDGSYIDAECSAFDDMFPTIDPCTMAGHEYPDHGEVCRIPHACQTDGKSIRLSCITDSVNVVSSKEITTDAQGTMIRYCIRNCSEEPLPYIWEGHMMFAGLEGAAVFSNAPAESGRRVMFGNAPASPEVLGMYSAGGESYKYYITEPFSS